MNALWGNLGEIVLAKFGRFRRFLGVFGVLKLQKKSQRGILTAKHHAIGNEPTFPDACLACGQPDSFYLSWKNG